MINDNSDRLTTTAIFCNNNLLLGFLRAFVAIFCSFQLIALVMFLVQIYSNTPDMIETVGLWKIISLFVIPGSIFIGGLFFLLKKIECVPIFAGYYIYFVLHAPFSTITLPAFSLSLISTISLISLKLTISRQFSKSIDIDKIIGPGNIKAYANFKQKFIGFVMRQDNARWLILNFGVSYDKGMGILRKTFLTVS